MLCENRASRARCGISRGGGRKLPKRADDHVKPRSPPRVHARPALAWARQTGAACL